MQNAMNKLHDNDLDKLFAEGLEDLREEPSDNSWKKIAAGIAVTTTVSSSLIASIFKPIAWVMSSAAIVSAVVLLNPSSENIKNVNNKNLNNDIVQEEISSKEGISAMPLLSRVTEIPIIFPFENINKINSVYENNFQNNNALNNNIAEAVVNKSEPDYYKGLQVSEADEDVANSQDENKLFAKTDVLQKMNLLSAKPISNGFINNNIGALPLKYFNTFDNDYIMPTWFSLGFNMGCDFFDFNIPDIESKVPSLNTELDFAFHFGDLYLSLGSNLIDFVVNNKYSYTITDYYESTSTEIPIKSDPVDIGGGIDAFYIYDSVSTVYDKNFKNKYSFIEIPFTFGFQKDVKRVSFYAESGFAFSFLVKNKTLNIEEFEQDAGINSVSWEKNTFEQNKKIQSFIFKAGVMYNTNYNLSFGLEPVYRYGLSPFYYGEKKVDSPVSFGIRAKLLYKL